MFFLLLKLIFLPAFDILPQTYSLTMSGNTDDQTLGQGSSSDLVEELQMQQLSLQELGDEGIPAGIQGGRTTDEIFLERISPSPVPVFKPETVARANWSQSVSTGRAGVNPYQSGMIAHNLAPQESLGFSSPYAAVYGRELSVKDCTREPLPVSPHGGQ